MNTKGNSTRTQPIEWNTMLGFTQRLKRDGLNTDYLLITCGCYFGLRISDLLKLKYSDVLDKDHFDVIEKKTKKRRTITINEQVREAVRHVAQSLERSGDFEPGKYLFPNRWGQPFSVSYVNKRLHFIFRKYNVRALNPSSHTLRKTFGKRVWEMDGKSERALVYLSEIFSHSSIATTRRYIGITQETIADIFIRL